MSDESEVLSAGKSLGMERRQTNSVKYTSLIAGTGRTVPTVLSTDGKGQNDYKKGIVTASVLNVRRGPGTNFPVIDKLPNNKEVYVRDYNNEWMSMRYQTGTAYVCKKYINLTPVSKGNAKQRDSKRKNAVSLARSFLGQKTHDLVGKLKYLKDLKHNRDTNNGFNLNCANFVSAILMEAGLLNVHQVSCRYLRKQCTSEGYSLASERSCVQPGDIWFGEGHTELVESNEGGRIQLIGSNNTSPRVQTVSLDTKNGANGTFYSLENKKAS